MAKRESSFKQSETSQGQHSSGESGRSHVSYAPGTEPSDAEVHLAMEVLKTPIIRKLLKEVREQLRREGDAQPSPAYTTQSELDPEAGIAMEPSNATGQITSTSGRVGSWVKRRLVSLSQGIRKRLEPSKYKDKTYDADLHVRGYNNATNTVVVVAALIATLSFAALLQPPGGLSDNGTAKLASKPAFKVFFISNGMALFVALLTILILTSVVPRSQNEARVLYEYGKVLVWLATSFTVVAFNSAAYIVSGRGNRVLAWIVFCAAAATIIALFAVVLVVSAGRELKKMRSRTRRRLQRSHPIHTYNRFTPPERNNGIAFADAPADQ